MIFSLILCFIITIQKLNANSLTDKFDKTEEEFRQKFNDFKTSGRLNYMLVKQYKKMYSVIGWF